MGSSAPRNRGLPPPDRCPKQPLLPRDSRVGGFAATHERGPSAGVQFRLIQSVDSKGTRLPAAEGWRGRGAAGLRVFGKLHRPSGDYSGGRFGSRGVKACPKIKKRARRIVPSSGSRCPQAWRRLRGPENPVCGSRLWRRISPAFLQGAACFVPDYYYEVWPIFRSDGSACRGGLSADIRRSRSPHALERSLVRGGEDDGS